MTDDHGPGRCVSVEDANRVLAQERAVTARMAAALERARRGFDCPTCEGIGRTFHDDMPDGSTRAQGCLACDGTGKNPRGPAAALDRVRALVDGTEAEADLGVRDAIHTELVTQSALRYVTERTRAALDVTEADRG